MALIHRLYRTRASYPYLYRGEGAGAVAPLALRPHP